MGVVRNAPKRKRAHAPIDWDQARDILIGWEQLVVTLHWLVEACNGIGWDQACDVLIG
jgi:hypothetical protein